MPPNQPRPLLHLGDPPPDSEAARIQQFILSEMVRLLEPLQESLQAYLEQEGIRGRVEWWPVVEVIYQEARE